MEIMFFLPSIGKIPTGGNIYNRRVIDRLKNEPTVHADVTTMNIRKWTDTIANGERSDHSVAVIDSLLVAQSEGIGYLRDTQTFSKLIMMVHYLRLLDPSQEDAQGLVNERETLENFDAFVTTSHFSKKVLIAHGFFGKKIGVVSPGLDPIYRQSQKNTPSSEKPRILTVSNVLPGKGLIKMVGMLEGLADLFWSWDHVGDTTLAPDHARRFKRRLLHSPISNRVRLHGGLSHDRLLELYDRSHLFALPSKFESRSIAIMEAMSRGLPVVAYGVGGIPEMIRVPGSARLIPRDDDASFVDALRELIDDHEMRLSLGRKSLENSKQFCSWRVTARQFWEFLSASPH